MYYGAFEQGIRITGIFGNPNTYAGLYGFGYSFLISYDKCHRQKCYDCTSLLAINALSYLLAFSMGSLFMFLIVCLIMIATTEKGKRISLFLLMIETAILTFIFAFVSMIGLGNSGIIGLTLLALVLNALLFIIWITAPASCFKQKDDENTKALYSTSYSHYYYCHRLYSGFANDFKRDFLEL